MSKKRSKEERRRAAQDCGEGKERGICGLCEQERKLTKHHLIPRAAHGKRKFRKMFGLEEMLTRGLLCCKLCHDGIHDLVPDELELAEFHNTKEALLAHERIAKHVAWSKKQKVI